MKLTENELWLLSFYRVSEITGAEFFARLAKNIKPSFIQHDLTKHFADESQHAWYWTKAIHDLEAEPIRIDIAYQDRYLEAAGLPVNVMEILAITQIFEKRVIGQYSLHLQTPQLNPVIKNTLAQIMEDEKWHIQWVGEALTKLEPKFGKDHIDATLKRYREADQEVYKKVLEEHNDKIHDILKRKIVYE